MDQNTDSLVGHRIRERRRLLGLKQAELAAEIEISASYLNLIEHNRRRIGGRVLVSLAKALGVEPPFLTQGAGAELVADLQGAAQDIDVKDALGDDAQRASEFAERFPGWANVIITQRGRIARLEALVDGLNDRLTHDPVLSETMHDVLSTVSAIRSTASILVRTPDLDAEWQERFHTNIDTESRRLAETSAAMAEHFEHLTRSTTAYVTPLEATQALFDRHDHHFIQIEETGFDGIEAVLDDAGLTAGPTQNMIRTALEAYAARALKMPLAVMSDLLHASNTVRPDIFADTLKVPLIDVLHRLAELPHTPGLPEIGCVRVDNAGSLLHRKQISGFALPRFGAGCSLWPVFAALSMPGHPISQTVITNENTAFTIYALATQVTTGSFDALPIYQSTMIMVADAPDTPTIKVGTACRVCPRKSCTVRREPSIIDTFTSGQSALEEF
ncbi:MAG: short-chain fatty acyl-CoA regulator family protein [Litoreibacter sp.]